MMDNEPTIDFIEISKYIVRPSEIIGEWSDKEQARFWAGDPVAIDEFEQQASDAFAGRRGGIDLESDTRQKLAANIATPDIGLTPKLRNGRK